MKTTIPIASLALSLIFDAGAQVPTMVQNVSTASNLNAPDNGLGTGNPGNPFHINLPNPAGAGNCLILALSCPYAAGRTIQVTDNAGDVWAPVESVNNGQTMSEVFEALSVAAGAENIVVTFDTTLYDVQFAVSEFYNVGGLDGAIAATTHGGTVSAGNITTSSNGDLVFQYGYDTQNPDGGTATLTGVVPGPGFTLLSADVFLGTFAQYMVQGSTGAATPSASLVGSTDSFNTIAVALKAAAQGTAPGSGIRVVHVSHFWYNKAAAAQFPSSGNLLYWTSGFGYNEVVLGASDNMGNSWTNLNNTQNIGNGPQGEYAANAATSPNLAVTISGPNSSYGASVVMYDVAGASTQPYDVQEETSIGQVNIGQFQLGSITPSTANELVFATCGTDNFFIRNGSPGVFDTVYYGNAEAFGNSNGADTMDNADAFLHLNTVSTSPVNFTWTLVGGFPSGFETFQAVAFKSASGNPTPTPTPTATPIPTPTPTPTLTPLSADPSYSDPGATVSGEGFYQNGVSWAIASNASATPQHVRFGWQHPGANQWLTVTATNPLTGATTTLNTPSDWAPWAGNWIVILHWPVSSVPTVFWAK